MSEAQEMIPAPEDPPKSTRVVTNRAATGAVVRWEAPSAESLADAFPGLKIQALCGVGGMGAVYRAEQIRLGRAVAVKVLPQLDKPDPEARERFEREARILSGLNHPHVLHIHDFGSLPDGTLYIVTEWAGGGDFAKLLDGKAHSLEQVQIWVRQIAEALQATHGHGVIHRDLKPGNVLVFEDGRLSLADFGLAHASGGSFRVPLTTNGSIFGTFEYMAPEQMESALNVTHSADLYALGVMTYLMITGRVPRCSYTRPSRLVKVPAEVDAFLDSALAHDVKRRPADAAEFARLFELACNAPHRRRQRQLVGLGIALVVLALAWSRAEVILAERRAELALATAVTKSEDFLPPLEVARPSPPPETGPATMLAPPAPLAPPADPEFVSVFSAEPISASLPLVSLRPAPELEPDTEPSIDATAEATSEVATAGEHAAVAAAPPKPASVPAPAWTWVLPEVKPDLHTWGGEWRLSGGELFSGGGRCALSLPVRGVARYDIAVEFTRTAGANSVVLFLPTSAGVGAFEVDAWNAGLAGLQLIDGADMRRQNQSFTARLINGEKCRLIIEVRGDQVAANWNGEPRMSWALQGRKLSIPALWQLQPDIGVGLGSWDSPTIFHRIAYRAWPDEARR